MRTDLKSHPVADIFPMLPADELAALAEDIKANGLRHPITLCDGMVLDGRNRLRACRMANVEPAFDEYDGDPVALVISENLKRRHLNESQRGMAAARLATLGHGGDRSKRPIGRLSQEEAGKLLNVGDRTVRRARAVLDRGAPALVAAVDAGEVAVSDACKALDLAPEEQAEVVEVVRAGEAKDAGRAAVDVRRAKRHAEIAQAKTIASEPPKDRRYSVILADPPWKYDNESSATRRASNQYECMPTDEIAALAVPSADDAVLFLWSTSPHLPDAMRVMVSWGFSYLTSLVWVKDKIGTGWWVREQHELLLIGKKGTMPPPMSDSRPSSIIVAPRQEHSRKPDVLYEIIESAFPTAAKAEMFARRQRDGWDSWGKA